MKAKITRAQRSVLEYMASRDGIPLSDTGMAGPTATMMRRLAAAGLVNFKRGNWYLLAAGLAALKGGSR
jgi:hypothetical protein